MITKNIEKAIEALNNDDLVSIPTETVYGLAGNALSEVALKKIFRLKSRPFYNPLILHIKSFEELKNFASSIPDAAVKLGKEFWPGPLTLVLKKHSHIPDLATAGKETVAIRVSDHSLTLHLLHKLDFPLAAPSANPFGSISPTSAVHVHQYFGDNLDVILDGGECEKGIESTIIGFEEDMPVIYRVGSISKEALEAVVGAIKTNEKKSKEVKSPGMLSNHYSPNTNMYFSDDVRKVLDKYPNKKTGLLLFNEGYGHENVVAQEVLSEKGDLDESARKLYAALHRLDSYGLDLIIAEKFPDVGLGSTINDRLMRASIKKMNGNL